MPETTTTYEHPCPECGGDSTASTRPGGTYRKRFILRLVCFLALLAGVIVPFAMTTEYTSRKSTPQPSAGLAFQQSYLEPIRPDSLSLESLRSAIDGDEAYLNDFVERLREFSKPLQPRSVPHPIVGLRIELAPYRFTETKWSSYGLFGTVIGVTDKIEYTDASQGLATKPTRNSTTFWPSLNYKWTPQGQGVAKSLWIDYIQILAWASLIMLGTNWMTKKLNRWQIPLTSKPSHRMMWGLVVLVILSGIIALNPRSDTSYWASKEKVVTSGEYIETERVLASLDDPERARTLLREMSITLMHLPEPARHAALIRRDYGMVPADLFLPDLEYSFSQDLKHPILGRLFKHRYGRYAQTLAPEDVIPVTTSRRWRDLSESGSINLSTSSIHERRTTTVGFKAIIILFACLLVAWGIAGRLVRLINHRVERRRYRRNLCVFCAYPLSDEAIVARNSDPPP